MTQKTKISKTFPLVALIVAATAPALPSIAADFSTAGWNSPDSFNVTVATTLQINGDLLHEGTWTTRVGATLLQGGTPATGELNSNSVQQWLCDSVLQVEASGSMPLRPQTCVSPFTSAPVNSPTWTVDGAGTTATFSFLFTAAEVAAFPGTHPYLIMIMGFEDQSGNSWYFPSDYMTVDGTTFSSNADGPGGSSAATPTPAKYSGPEFSGLAGMGIMTGSTGKLAGKRLDQISSIEIGGNAATFTATSATELELSLPAGLAPGLYDLVINSSAGKLTHINAIQVREPKQSFSITTRSTGKISEEQYLEHSLIAGMQAPELNKARCIVNASTQAMAEAMAKRLCAIVKASKPNIETTVVVPRSTVRNDTVFARVIYGWN